jgi:hypothetical protein
MSAPAKPPDSKDARTERLAAALRENLKRRKVQAREKTQVKAPIGETKPDPG